MSVVGMCLGGTVAGLIAAQEEKVDKAVLMVSPGSPADLSLDCGDHEVVT
ncbi:hypothetical protein [Sinorhizobium medicae]|nr:hypothetical protein U8C38_27705 [Sinorhizobium medicae]